MKKKKNQKRIGGRGGCMETPHNSFEEEKEEKNGGCIFNDV